MKFYFNDASKRFKRKPFKIEAESIFKKLKISDKLVELGLNIVDNKKIQKLNKKYRRTNKPTNVLSFPIERPQKNSKQYTILGDIVISFEEAAKESDEFDKPIDEVMLIFFRHGLLHLIGYNHTKNKKKWEQIESKIGNC